MNAVELLKVADAVDETPSNKLRMEQWECRTARCAIGSYCAHNPDSELKMDRSCFSDHYPVFEHYGNWEAITRFFGINFKQANYLFYTYYGDPEPSEVSSRIRNFVKDHS